MDGGVQQDTVHGVAKSQTRLHSGTQVTSLSLNLTYSPHSSKKTTFGEVSKIFQICRIQRKMFSVALFNLSVGFNMVDKSLLLELFSSFWFIRHKHPIHHHHHVKNLSLQCGRPKFYPWVGKIPWRRKWQLTPVFFSEKSHGQRSLVGYSLWGRKSWTCDLVTKPPPPPFRTTSSWFSYTIRCLLSPHLFLLLISNLIPL